MKQKKLEDVEFIKSQSIPGPFTSKKEVQDYFMNADIPDIEKRERLYKKVRYARKTSLSLPPNAAVFKLRNGGRYLETKDYAKNLSEFLDDSKCVKSLTMSDLHEVLNQIQGEYILYCFEQIFNFELIFIR